MPGDGASWWGFGGVEAGGEYGETKREVGVVMTGEGKGEAKRRDKGTLRKEFEKRQIEWEEIKIKGKKAKLKKGRRTREIN